MISCVFIHGLGQSSSSWGKTTSLMAESCHSCCPDLFSLFEGKEVTYAGLYKAFSDYCAEVTEPVHLCGVSLGAILALNYAADFPQKVQSLVLIGAQYKMPKGLLKFQNIVFKLMPESSFKKMGADKKAMTALAASMMELDFTKRLKDISCRTLVLCGERDKANRKASKALTELIPNAVYQVVVHAGHEVNVDCPEYLAEILGAFYRHSIHQDRIEA